MTKSTGKNRRDPRWLESCPHPRPCWCDECHRAYHKAYSSAYNRRTESAESRNPHLFAECPHPNPCWCSDCRRAFSRCQTRAHKLTPSGLAIARQAAIQQYHKRRAAKLERKSEPYTVAQLMERDGGRCHICKGKVDPALPAKHPRGATVDHILPLSAGGDDTLANVAIAHWECNLRKGNRPANDQLRLIG